MQNYERCGFDKKNSQQYLFKKSLKTYDRNQHGGFNYKKGKNKTTQKERIKKNIVAIVIF